MQKVKACGVLVFRRQPEPSFLAMKHRHRLDLPKGHLEPGETDIECALRETWEETGIPRDALELDPDFQYQEVYYPFEARFGPGRVEKTLIVYLGWLLRDCTIQVTEHIGYTWLPWRPPHNIQKYTFNPLLAKLERYFEDRKLLVQ